MSETTPPTSSPEPSPPPPLAETPPPRRERSAFKRILTAVFWLLFGLSIAMNVFLVATVGTIALGGQLFAKPLKMDRAVLTKGDMEQVVAVYRVSGVIDQGTVAGFQRFYDAVVDDDNVRAIVLRVNSPGGGVTSSNEVHHMVKRLQEAGKIVVVSMGAVAASGGYMISCSADHILAEPTTITGSIGVIMTWLVLEETLDRIGIQPVVIKSAHADYWKDDASLLRQPDQRQIAHLRDILNQMQEQFEQSVRQGRGDNLQLVLPTEPEPLALPTGLEPLAVGEFAEEIDPDANAPFNGKAYLAADALELGLIDEIGYRQEAIDRAAELAGLDEPHVVAYTHRVSRLARLLLSAERDNPLQQGADLLEDLQTPRIMAIWKVD